MHKMMMMRQTRKSDGTSCDLSSSSSLMPDSIGQSPISAHSASAAAAAANEHSSSSYGSAFNPRMIRLPSLSSTTSISSSSSTSQSTIAPLSKMFSLPSRPSMRRLVPSPSMPSLRLELRRERSKTEMREESERRAGPRVQSPSSSYSPPTVDSALSSQTSTTTTTTSSSSTSSSTTTATTMIMTTAAAAATTSSSSSASSSALSKLHGARQMLFSSTRRRTGTASSSSTTVKGDSTSHGIMNDSFWRPESSVGGVMKRSESRAGASPTSVRSELSVASPPPQIIEPNGQVLYSNPDEARRDSSSTQTTVSSPPTSERILPPEEMIATIDRIRKEQRLAAASTSSASVGDSSFGLGLSGVSIHQEPTGSSRNRSTTYYGRRPSTSMSIDESCMSHSSSSSPVWTDDAKGHVGSTPVPSRSPTVSQFSISGSNGGSVTAVVEHSPYSHHGGRSSIGSNTSTPNILDISHGIPSPTLSSASPNQQRSLPVPPRIGKKSRSYANGLNTFSSNSSAPSPVSIQRPSSQASSPVPPRLPRFATSSRPSTKASEHDCNPSSRRNSSPAKRGGQRTAIVEPEENANDFADDENDKENAAVWRGLGEGKQKQGKNPLPVANVDLTHRGLQHSSSTNSFGIRHEASDSPRSEASIIRDHAHNDIEATHQALPPPFQNAVSV